MSCKTQFLQFFVYILILIFWEVEGHFLRLGGPLLVCGPQVGNPCISLIFTSMLVMEIVTTLNYPWDLQASYKQVIKSQWIRRINTMFTHVNWKE